LSVGDYYVVGGVHASSPFQVQAKLGVNGSYDVFQHETAPWAGWDVSGHRWSAGSSVASDASSDLTIYYGGGNFIDAWGCADESFAMIVARAAYVSYSNHYYIYLGALTPRYLDTDPRPIGHLTAYSSFSGGLNSPGVRMIATDGVSQQKATGFYVGSSSSYLLAGAGRDKCYYSNKYMYLPSLVGGLNGTLSEIRGELQHCYLTHDSGTHFGTPCGVNRQFLRFNDFLMDWNGSKQRRLA